MSRAVVIVNRHAGVQYMDGLIRLALQQAGIDADIREPSSPSQLRETARAAARNGAAAVIASGGDGTVATVAGEVAEADGILGVLPMGTLNHFARDLGIPSDLREAARVIARGNTRRVDMGDVNGRIFLNNCSIGLYPRMVRRRESQRQRLGRGKWYAMAVAALSLFRRYPLVHLTLEVEGQIIRCKTPLVFIGNNRYETDLLNLGRRTALDRGELSVYLAKATGRLDLLLLALRMLVGRLKQARDFENRVVTQLTIETRKRRVRIACDGEVVRMHPPLVCRVRPGALKVLAP
ncbi:MAG TPA: diacylglycerol kinase family protein [Tepidisphaeraceae bacterium]|nr:diacylglycerol kinase family protein [Tepidisphaeraceae bacterium]